jgi:hypothetical protein
MTITAYDIRRLGPLTIQVSVTSDLGGSPIYYHWYVDGRYDGKSLTNVRQFTLQAGEQADVICQDTTSTSYDPIANAPDGFPARKTLWWLASAASDVELYAIEQQKDGGDWEEIGRVRDTGAWEYRFLTPPLDDLSTYRFRVKPYDAAGNAGTTLALDAAAETIVRKPDAPDFDISFDEGTAKITFSEAS